ncbi:ABC transporter ATP-binding protein [Streptomyces axinellae]|uniref:ABC transporter ATP-binding protein n=1 Tax=Streptomyces axinellae TaxID=552788 RepID=A0ABN3QXH9_9ACTN
MNAATTATASTPASPSPPDTAISVSGLVKTFGRTRALDGLDLKVATGEVHGFLGPNGAGKSTTLRVLLGLLRADTGTARLLGADPWADAVALHQRLAYVPGDVELWPNLTGGEAIDLLARLRGGIDQGRRAELIERFDLDPTKKGRTYSKGNRQKVAIIAALASDAELLLLDEPTAGLDPLMEVVFQDVILQAKAAGRTVLLSSHILSQVEKLCDRVSIIRLGKIVQSGTLSEMRHLTRTTIEAETVPRPPDGEDPGARLTGLGALPGVHNLRTEGNRVHFAVDGAHLDAAVRYLSALGVRSLVSHPPTLEELMLRHYGDELAANGHGHEPGREQGHEPGHGHGVDGIEAGPAAEGTDRADGDKGDAEATTR